MALVRSLLVVLLLAALAGCGDEDGDKRRFDDDAAAASASSGFGGMQATATGAGGATASGSGGSGGTTTQACANASVTVGALTLTEGDAEFNGHGPVVTATVDVTASAGTVVFEACVEMKETVSDWTTGVGCKTHTVTVANGGLVGNPSFSAKYTDSDHAIDNVLSEATSLKNEGNVVGNAQCVGDTEGDDICPATSCSRCLFVIGCVEVNKP